MFSYLSGEVVSRQIRDSLASHDGKWCQHVRAGLAVVKDLCDLKTPNGRRVSNKGPVTPPGDRLRAHNRGRLKKLTKPGNDTKNIQSEAWTPRQELTP